MQCKCNVINVLSESSDTVLYLGGREAGILSLSFEFEFEFVVCHRPPGAGVDAVPPGAVGRSEPARAARARASAARERARETHLATFSGVA
jgi:hypothetical protein